MKAIIKVKVKKVEDERVGNKIIILCKINENNPCIKMKSMTQVYLKFHVKEKLLIVYKI